MRRIVIDLDRDLPHRAAPLSDQALANVFGGCGYMSICGGGLTCCQGLVCKESMFLGIPASRCKFP